MRRDPKSFHEAAADLNRAMSELGHALLDTALGRGAVWLVERLNALAIRLGL